MSPYIQREAPPYADALPDLAGPGRGPLHLVSVIHSGTPDTDFQREGTTRASRLLEERDLGLKMTFSGVVLCQNQGPDYS